MKSSNMKSESEKMLRHILFIVLLLVTLTISPATQSETKKYSSSFSSSSSTSFTSSSLSSNADIAEKEPSENSISVNFSISSEESSSNNSNVLDNLEEYLPNKQFASTKGGKPELNPILSQLINEDVKKSIDAKRFHYHLDDGSDERELTLQDVSPPPIPTSIPMSNFVLTTTTTTESNQLDNIPKMVNQGLIDQSINFDEAGSENKQTSKIQVKKGANGIEYEYEYIYYYYDDDEAAAAAAAGKGDKSKDQIKVDKKDIKDQKDRKINEKENANLGKNRYVTTIDNSNTVGSQSGSTNSNGNAGTNGRGSTVTTSLGNEINRNSINGRGRQSIPVVEVNEERLPLNTRFPPRATTTTNNNGNTNNNLNSVTVSPDTTQKKLAVKRPSLEIDNQSFNTDEKAAVKVAVSRSNLESEYAKETGNNNNNNSNNNNNNVEVTKQENEEITLTTEDLIETTPLMDKVALDLYAILANDYSNLDSTTTMLDSPTDGDQEYLTTDLNSNTDNVSDLVDDLTTEDEFLTSSSTTTSTTTTTTTPEPTTTTTTTTTTPPPPPPPETPIDSLNGRRQQFGGGRNRFRLRTDSAQNKIDSSTTTTTTTTTTTPAPEITPQGHSFRPKNRFSRPSFTGSRISKPTTASTTSAEIISSAATPPDEIQTKIEVKPVSSGLPIRGRARNRFNLRGSSITPAPVTTTPTIPQTSLGSSSSSSSIEDKEIDDDINENIISSSVRPVIVGGLRQRPSLQIRPRGGRLPSQLATTTTTTTIASTIIVGHQSVDDEEKSVADTSGEKQEEKHILTPTRPSRFNLGRPANRLLNRGRNPVINNLRNGVQHDLETSSESGVAAANIVVATNSNEDNVENGQMDTSTVASTTTVTQNGLNRLKTRPRIQINARPERPVAAGSGPNSVNRKINPLLARKKFGNNLTTVTSEASPIADLGHNDDTEQSQESNEASVSNAVEPDSDKKDESTETIVEVTSETLRGLGLLGNRRRLPIRRPGTIL